MSDGLDDVDLGLLCDMVRKGGSATLTAMIGKDADKSFRNLCSYRLRRLVRLGVVRIVPAISSRTLIEYQIEPERVKQIKNGVLLDTDGGHYAMDDFIVVDFGSVLYLHRHSYC